ncbi:hypothetical protein CLV28_1641 [Sediminihabitans luteus]|uniref:LemA protein n=1 Tax=Sediminihabitans luteus TaxID=1138585 RepID=A0A2M9CQH7_9CELL|nr:hypothetical protein [Sediminihabitans luteus]PJJ74147.1 hypothetical protein CLV28_1641 [Sediminihabitans luteus]GII99000.1 membrane protein [Sediminihabitans luteus]
MTWSEIVILVVVVLALAGWSAWLAANRLDRLHRKVVASRTALDSQLVRRAAAASELAGAGVLDPASSLLVAQAVYEVSLEGDAGDRELARAVPELARDLTHRSVPTVRDSLAVGFDEERARAESDLSAILRGALGTAADVAQLRAHPDADALLQSLSAAWYRVQIARRFHNEAVAQAQRVRRKWWVRTFRIAGRAALPVTVELDDAWPAGLGRPAAAVSGA